MTVSLFGLKLYSGNKGCEALCYAFLDMLSELFEKKNKVLDVAIYTFPSRNDVMFTSFNDWKNLNIRIEPIRLKSCKFWKLLKQNLKKTDVCFDFTEGDSFSDLYGLKRFMVQTFLKTFVIKNNKCFILAPQTYGPYKTKISKIWAKWIFDHSKKIYSRDLKSKELLSSMTNNEVVAVTDVAIALVPKIEQYIEKTKIIIGINVSGLLWNGGYTQKNQFNLATNYKDYIDQLVKILSSNDKYTVYLIPHVIVGTDYDHVENDLKVCAELHRKYPRTKLIDRGFSPSLLKGIISQMDIFTGARMHSTIAAFSSGVPVIPFSYSKKFQSFFYALDYNFIVDGKVLSTEDALRLTLDYIACSNNLKQAVEKSLINADMKVKAFKQELESILEGKVGV